MLLEMSTLKKKNVAFSENQNSALKMTARMNKVERKKKMVKRGA